MEHAAVVTRYVMRKPLRGLACIAYSAPMVGMLGTCFGLIDAFRGWCPNFPGGVLGGLAEGFVPLALGLSLGLPAFWAYRYLSHSADQLDLEMAYASSQVSRYLASR